MKKKNFLLHLCMALAFTVPTAVATGCQGGESDTSSSVEQQVDYGQDGTYYCVDDNTSEITLDDGSYTLKIGGETKTGKYTYDGKTFSFTGDKAITNVTFADDVLTFTYDGVTYTFLEKVDYTVTYQAEGATYQTQTVRNGKKATAPTAPTKAGWAFVGWYTNSTYTVPFAFEATAITANTTLYAKFVQVTVGTPSYTVSYVVDGVVYGTANTVNGAVYQLPTPTKDNAKFVGWWLSDYNDATKLTTKIEDGTVIKENVTLYAVWESDAPNASISGKTISWTAKGVNNQYTVRILAENGSEIAKTVTSQSSYTYNFDEAEAGNYVIEVTLNGKTSKIYYKNKALATVSGFGYSGTDLVWNTVPNATHYLVSIQCGDSAHTHVDEVITTNAYDFKDCAMKADGIKFTVKAVAEGYMTSNASEFVVVKNLDAVTGLAYNAAEAKFTWNTVAGATRYDVTVNGATTTTTANSFDVKNLTGDITISVVPVAFGYNSPTASELAYNKASLPVPTGIKLVASTVTWDAVAGATGYVVKINEKEYNVTDESFDILTADNIAADAKGCNVSIKAIGATDNKNSVYSDAVQVGFGVMADAIVYKNGEVSWQPVINVKGYEVQVNNGTIIPVAATAEKLAIEFTQKGAHVIKVRCIDGSNKPSEWVTTTVNVYEITFDFGRSPETADPMYLATGDTLELPANPQTPGYTFDGWHNAATNGVKYNGEKVTFEGVADQVVYAYWTANTYKITYKYVVNGETKQGVEEVVYGESYKLPDLAEFATTGLSFRGWWSELNGQGIEYTDNLGESLTEWRGLSDITVYASVAEAFKYAKITTAGGKEAYSVAAGADFREFSDVTIPAVYGEGVDRLPVAWIDANAFASKTNLKKLSIPDSIERIYLGLDGGYEGPGSAFYQCSNLEEIKIYDASEAMKAAGINSYNKYYTSIEGALVRLTENDGKELAFVPVTKESPYNVPDGITSLAINLFRSYHLDEIIIPASVTRIEDGVFRGCYAKTITIKDGENAGELTLGAEVFRSADITTLHIPARMGKIEKLYETFYYCEFLKSITVEEGNQYYSANKGMLFDANGDTLLYCPRGLVSDNLEIPNGTKTIATQAFGSIRTENDLAGMDACESITKVVIPASVTDIKDSAFEHCNAITTLEFKGVAGDPLMNIGKRAFYGTILTALELPGNTGKVDSYAFGAIATLTTVTIKAGDGFTAESGAFASSLTNTYYVTTLRLAKCVPAFGINGAFGSSTLRSIVFYENNLNDHMTLQDDVLFDKDITEIIYYPGTKTTTNYEIPDTVTKIGANVFSGKKMAQVTIPYKVTSIGVGAFASCANLTTVIFKPATEGAAKHTGLAIGENAFASCSRLATIALPSYTKTIGKTAFKGSGLDGTFVIPEGVTELGDMAFENCSKLDGISIPSTLTSLIYATDTNKTYSQLKIFSGCTTLASITVASGNTKYMVQDGVLYEHEEGVPVKLVYCPAKYVIQNTEKKFTVPYTVNTIFAYAFSGNTSLKELAFEEAPANVQQSIAIQKNAFEKTTSLLRVTLGGGLKTLKAGTFSGCSKLTYVRIPTSVTLIEQNVFSSCSKVTSLIFDELAADEAGEELVIKGAAVYGYTGSAGLAGLSGLQTLTLPGRLKTIDYYCFAPLTALVTINIPSSVTNIQTGAFKGCKNLKNINIADVASPTDEDALTLGTSILEGMPIASITLPNRTKSIGASAFKGTNLSTITIPANIESIGNNAFQNCASLATVNFNGTSKLASIGDYAFATTALTSFNVPASVKTIGKYAFAYMKGLTAVNFAQEGSALTKIDNYAFCQSGLLQLIVPESSAQITLGESLFQYCMDITKVQLSASVIAATKTFMGCASLKQVIIDPDNENLSEEGDVVYNSDKSAIQFIYTPVQTENGVYRIADGVTSIAAGAFKGQVDIKTLHIPASVTSIGANAFEGCTNLEEVIFDNIQTAACASIGDYAFYNCYALKKITLPNGATSLGNYAFQNCYALNQISIPGVTTLGSYAFYNCTSLDKITLNDDMTTIGNYAFGYSGLESVRVPSKLTIANVNSSSVTDGLCIFYRCEKLATVTIPDGVEKLGYYMFYGCTSLESVDVPESVLEFGLGVFRGSGLKSFAFKRSMPVLSTYTFAGCTNLETVTLPSEITTIPGYTFDGCTSLGSKAKAGESSVIIPDSVTSVANYAFQNCTSLKYMKFPEGVTFFGAGAEWKNSATSNVLYGCTSLEKVTLSKNFENIGKNAFQNCVNLKTVENLDNVKRIEDNAFRDTGVQSISLPNVTYIGKYAFANAVDLSMIVLSKQLTGILDYTFQGTASLKVFVIPDLVASIAKGAFKGSGIESITLPSLINKINDETFMDCENLAKVESEGAITSIGKNAFENCASLKNFEMSEDLTTIGASAFMNSGLTSVALPAKVTSIGANAFASCQALTTFTVDPANTSFKVEGNVLRNKSNQYVQVLSGYPVEDGVLYITAENNITLASSQTPFFGNDTITKVVVTANWTSVPSKFFSGMSALTEVQLPATVTTISANAFENAKALTTVIMPGVKTIGNYAFNGCEALENINTDNLTSIGTYAFAGSGLKAINIPGTVKTISQYAFYGTKNLKSITLNQGLTTIDNYAFAESGVESITIPASVTTFGNTAVYIKEPDGKTGGNIKVSYAFANCTSLQTVVFLGTNPTMNGHTFEGCTALTSVTLPSNMTFVEDYMFYGCTSLKNVTLPDTVKEIGGYAFAYSGLTSITLPANLTVIGTPNLLTDSKVADANNPYQTGATQTSPVFVNPNGHTFTGCADLETVNILGNVTYIGWYSFEGCSKLKNITLPGTVGIIGDYAFANCTSLTALNLPESLTHIGHYAFANSKIASIVIPDNTIVYDHVFEGWTTDQTINVVKTAYKATCIWNTAWYLNSNATIVWAYVVEE